MNRILVQPDPDRLDDRASTADSAGTSKKAARKRPDVPKVALSTKLHLAVDAERAESRSRHKST
jgi:hypothetical protein